MSKIVNRVIIAGDQLVDLFPPSPESTAFYERTGFHSMIAAPITGDEGPLGVIEVYAVAADAFEASDAALIQALASQAATDTMFMHEKRDLSRVTATERAAAAAYRQAGKSPTDVDVVELHDFFTIAEIVATEGLGFVEPGAGGVAAEKGWTSLGGKIPVNPSGGLKAKGHPIGATGAAQIAEIVTQLRGEAGARQVEGARTGLTHTLGGNTATVLVSLFGRD